MYFRLLLSYTAASFVLLVGWGSAAAEDPVLLRYKPVREIVYAVQTKVGPKTKDGKFFGDRNRRGGEPFLIYRLRFAEKRQTTELKRQQVELPYVRYGVNALDVPSLSSEWDGSFYYYSDSNFSITAGGMLPLFYALWQAKQMMFLSHVVIVEWPLMFPVFGKDGTKADVGTKWESPLPPVIMRTLLVLRLIMKKVKIEDLPPSKMQSEFVRWRTFGRRKCAEIKFSMNVNSSNKIEQGKEKGTFSLTGTSIFDPELGWPLMTEYKAKGLTIDEKGKKHEFFLERREVMVSVKTFEETKLPKKKKPAVKKTIKK